LSCRFRRSAAPITGAEKRASNTRRIDARSSASTRRHASTAASSLSTMNPVVPSSMTSGTDPQRHAITGVPRDIASIITRPNGSGQSIGKTSARAPSSSASFSRSPSSPRNSTCGSSINGSIVSLK
jgi:hypothetical protein